MNPHAARHLIRMAALGVIAACATPAPSRAQAGATPAPAVTQAAPEPEAHRAPAAPRQVPGIEVLGGEGLHYFSGNRVERLRIGPAEANGRHLVLADTQATTSVFNAHVDAATFVRDGVRRSLSRPTQAIGAPDGTVYLVYEAASPMRLAVQFAAYDVGGQPMREFLRTGNGYVRPEAQRLGEQRFPAGAVAYLANVRFVDDTLVLPSRESFTGASTTRQMVGNFSRNVPFCLSYEDRDGARPYALHFKESSTGKGKTELWAAKPGTLFCDRGSPRPLATGDWEERTVGGTRAIVLSFAPEVDPLDTGVTLVEREAAAIAFIEIKSGGGIGVRPGKLYRAGAQVLDHEFRFNRVAADAIRSALGAM